MRISDWSSDVCSSDRLMAAHLSGQRVSVSSLCIAAAVPATTALRWIRALTDHGLFLRQADPSDGRRVFIALSDKAAEAVALFFADAQRGNGMMALRLPDMPYRHFAPGDSLSW